MGGGRPVNGYVSERCLAMLVQTMLQSNDCSRIVLPSNRFWMGSEIVT